MSSDGQQIVIKRRGGVIASWTSTFVRRNYKYVTAPRSAARRIRIYRQKTLRILRLQPAILFTFQPHRPFQLMQQIPPAQVAQSTNYTAAVRILKSAPGIEFR